LIAESVLLHEFGGGIDRSPNLGDKPVKQHNSDPLRVLQALALTVLLTVLTGHILLIGKNILMPIFVAIISVYILVTASQWIARQPGGRLLTNWLRQLLVISAFMVVLILLGGVITSTAGQVSQRLPVYEENLAVILHQTLGRFGPGEGPDLAMVWASLTAAISLQAMALQALGSFASLGGLIFLVALYASFLLAERDSFPAKIAAALPGEGANHAARMIADINRNIGNYLTMKTLINSFLGALSFVILWLFGLDFAIFWAVLIALLNYIPYIGSYRSCCAIARNNGQSQNIVLSIKPAILHLEQIWPEMRLCNSLYIGVLFPTVLSLAQFGSLSTSLLLTALLVAAQFVVGNILEPRLIGRKVNMSPFVVMVALSIWAALWGIPGAILAVPLTSVLLIVLAGFQASRPIAILLSNDVTAFRAKEE
jgi:predicted PurR-regulated permease PerM